MKWEVHPGTGQRNVALLLRREAEAAWVAEVVTVGMGGLARVEGERPAAAAADEADAELLAEVVLEIRGRRGAGLAPGSEPYVGKAVWLYEVIEEEDPAGEAAAPASLGVGAHPPPGEPVSEAYVAAELLGLRIDGVGDGLDNGEPPNADGE